MHQYISRLIQVTALTASLTLLSSMSQADDKQKLAELSLNSSVLFALDNSPDIGIKTEKEHQVEAAIDGAKALLYPDIQFQASVGRAHDIPLPGGEDGEAGAVATNLMSIMVKQHIFDGGIKKNNIEQQENILQASKANTETTVESVIMDTVKHYLSVYRFQNSLEDSKKFLIRVSEVVSTVEEMFDAGASSKVTYDYAKSRESAAKTEFNNVVSSLNDSVSNLEFLTGPLPEFKTVLPADLMSDTLDRISYLEMAMKSNSLLKANNFEEASVDNKIEAIQGEFHPSMDFTFDAQNKYNDSGLSGHEQKAKAMFNFKYKLFDGYARDARKRGALSMKQEVKLKRDKIIRSLKKEIKLAYNQITSVRTSIASTNDEIESNIALQDLNMENFKLGTINVIELIEGEERLNAAYLKRHKLVSDLYLNSFKLEILVGALDGKDFCASC